MNSAQQTEINMDTQRGRRVTIYLEPSIADHLQEWCETEERTMTYAISEALGMWFGGVHERGHTATSKPSGGRRAAMTSDDELAGIILDVLKDGPRKTSDMVLAALDRGFSENQVERVRNILRKKRKIGMFRVAQGSRWFLVQRGQAANDQSHSAKGGRARPLYQRVQDAATSREPMLSHECYSMGELISVSRITEKHLIQKYITRSDDPLPFTCIIGGAGFQKYGFPRAETDAWLDRNGYRGAK
jgi:hypothetical protein